mgnify:CR=1 FL=1
MRLVEALKIAAGSVLVAAYAFGCVWFFAILGYAVGAR